MLGKIRQALEKTVKACAEAKARVCEAVGIAKTSALLKPNFEAVKQYYSIAKAKVPASSMAQEVIYFLIYLFVGLFVLHVLTGALAISNTSVFYPVYEGLISGTGKVFNILITMLVLLVVFIIVKIVKTPGGTEKR